MGATGKKEFVRDDRLGRNATKRRTRERETGYPGRWVETTISLTGKKDGGESFTQVHGRKLEKKRWGTLIHREPGKGRQPQSLSQKELASYRGEKRPSSSLQRHPA